MSILDYHAKNLLPSVWSPDGTLSMRFRAQLDEQMQRFPDVQAFLVGDAVSHYWHHTSDVDVILLTPPDDVVPFRQQVKRASNYPLVGTDNNLRFWIMPDSTTPAVLSKHFGPLYDLATGSWYGKVTSNEMELGRPETILQYVTWRLYTAKFSEDLFPETWRVAAEAFSTLNARERTQVLDDLRFRLAAVDRSVNKVLTSQPKSIWQRAEAFEQEVLETEDLPDSHLKLPRRVVLAVLHRFRYQDLLDTLTTLDEKLHKMARVASISERDAKSMVQRMDQILNMLIMRSGGSSGVVDGLVALFSHILDSNRYVISDMQRRKIALRLYRKYYSGQDKA